MVTGMTTATTSPTVALLTFATIAGAGIAYWSSASNTTAFGTIILEILRLTGTLKERGNGDKRSGNEEKNEAIDLKKAFVSWLDREENENNVSHPRNTSRASEKENLTDPHWMSETVRTGLLSTTRKLVMVGAVDEPIVIEDDSSTLLSSSSEETETIQETTFSPISPPIIDHEEILYEASFHRSFRTLQKVTEEMIERQPDMREDFFNGVIVQEENDKRFEEQKLGRGRSQSTSSSGSYETNEDSCLVEEEGEVERLLTYLRFVDLVKGEALSSSSSGSHKNHLVRANGYIQHRRERIIPDNDGYKHLRFATMEIEDATDIRRAKVGYMAAVHRDRKELVIAVHYDGSLLCSSSNDDCNQIKTILMRSLILQQQYHSSISMATASSGSFLLLDQAVKTLFEEILTRYLHNNTAEDIEASQSILSSGYSLVLCGHSLGAALACRLGDMVIHRNRDTVSEPIKVHVYAFGPPPCLPSQQKNYRDGSGHERDYPYIISVVNNHDSIPRWTEPNLFALRMSLQWTMDRKKRHFLRYHNRYNQTRSSTNPAAASKADGMRRRPSPRIPSFSLSPRDWNTFWKSNQEPNGAFPPQGNFGEVDPTYIVPGKIVSIWNHSQDPTIIGAKVHDPGTRYRHPSSSNCHHLSHHHKGNRKNHDVLGRLWVDEGMFSDHTIEAYRLNLELLLGQVGNTI